MIRKPLYQFPKLYLKKNFCNAAQRSPQRVQNVKFIPHTPVLCKNVVEYLVPGPNKTIIDMTFGAGGHSRKILEKFENVKIYALDCDPVSYGYAKQLANEYPGQIIPLLGKFSDLPLLFKSMDSESIFVDGVLFDFGCSSMQFDEAERGFSLSKDGPLDMRMNNTDTNQLTAAEVLSKIDENNLAKILKIYGGEKQAKKIARCITNARSMLIKMSTTKQLADIVSNCLSDNHNRVDKLQRPSHSATKTFQALRIFVNNELNEINFGMILAHKLLKLNGRIVTLTFHSLEDTIVKRHLQGFISEEGNAKPLPLKYSNHALLNDKEILENIRKKSWLQLHKHVITPSENETKQNPRSRSAKLRAAVKIL